MLEVGAFEAKTHFSQLLADVANGKSIAITKHGEKIAILIPVKKSESKVSSAGEAIIAIRKLRKGVTLGKTLSIKEMRMMGQK